MCSRLPYLLVCYKTDLQSGIIFTPVSTEDNYNISIHFNMKKIGSVLVTQFSQGWDHWPNLDGFLQLLFAVPAAQRIQK